MPIGWLVLEDTPDKLVHLKTQLTHNLIRGIAWIQSNISVESLECERTPYRQEMELETTTSVSTLCVGVCGWCVYGVGVLECFLMYFPFRILLIKGSYSSGS